MITLKANQLITHRKRFKKTKSTINRFYRLAEILENKLSCILFQFPPHKSKDIDFLKKALQQLDPSKSNIIEFKHLNWFDDEVYELLKEFNAGFCSISSSNIPEEIITTSNITYARFHGKGADRHHYSYSQKELEKWGENIKN